MPSANRVLLVFPIAIDRADHRIALSDIPAALRDFQQKTGMPADCIYISPWVKKRFEGAVTEGIIMEVHNGVASWEIWLGAENYRTEPVNVDTLPGGKTDPDIKPPEYTKEPPVMKQRGRPRISGPYMSRTTRWRRIKEAHKMQEALV